MLLTRVVALTLTTTVLLSGCGYNPLAPKVKKVPVFYDSVDDMPGRLRSGEDVQAWIKGNGVEYVSEPPRYVYYNELCCRQWAEELLRATHRACYNFASFYVWCAKQNGRKAGYVAVSGGAGHMLGWMVEDDGSVSISNNEDFTRSAYKSMKEAMSQSDTATFYNWDLTPIEREK